MSRRFSPRIRTIAVAGAAAALLAAAPAAVAASRPSTATLPVNQIEKVLRADGTVSNGVLTVEINRTDLHITGPAGVRFVHGFQIQHELAFQMIGKSEAMYNGDLALKPSEMQPVIDAILANHLVFQAEHQHLYNLSPMVWFVHFRGTGGPVDLAKRVAAVVAKTSTPLPQSSPAHPTTPLPVKQLATILGGSAEIGDNGVVTVSVERTNPIVLGGHRIKPDLNVANTVQFQPRGRGNAVVIPDIAMTSSEVNPVVSIMRHNGWESGCLYNQEIDESPQLYFDHFFHVGNAVSLAHQIRAALDHTDA